MTWHFSGWNFIVHIFSHFSRASRSSCSLFASASDLISLYKRQSSAKRRESEWLPASGRSLIRAKKSKGPSTVSCGTSEITSAWDNLHPSNSTRFFLLPRKDSIYCSVCPLTPTFATFHQSPIPLWHLNLCLGPCVIITRYWRFHVL